MNRARAEHILASLGLELAEGSGRQPDGSWHATIDAAGRFGFSGECRGSCVADYTATAHAFWAEVVAEARDIAPHITPCPHSEGECEFHDDEETTK